MTATFNPPVAQVMEALRRGIHETHEEATIVLGNRIINKTPRRTGRLQNGWNYSITSPDRTTPDEGRYGRKVIPLRLSGSRHPHRYLTNTVPYVRYREYGGGMGAPTAFVQSTIPDFPSIVGRLIPHKFK